MPDFPRPPQSRSDFAFGGVAGCLRARCQAFSRCRLTSAALLDQLNRDAAVIMIDQENLSYRPGRTCMKIDGHCHCGEVVFEAEVDPGAVNICHCTDCQTLSGSAFRVNIPAPAEHFVLLSGTPKTYIKTARAATNAATPSAAGAARRSTPVRWTIRRAMACVSGQLHSALPSHRSEGWRRSALHWVDALAAVPATEKGSTG
jgi:hypothetical protein